MHSLSVFQAGDVQYSKIMTENKICKNWTRKEDSYKLTAMNVSFFQTLLSLTIYI